MVHSSWEQALDPGELWGDPMTERLESALTERLGESQAARTRAVQIVEQPKGTQPKPDAGAAREQAKQMLAKLADYPAPPAPEKLSPTPLRLPVPHSCISGWGPYNQWERAWGGNLTELTHHALGVSSVTTAQPRVLTDNISNFGPASGQEVVRGSGCWFSVDHTGPASLTVEWFFNAHAAVITYLLGGGEALLRLAGSVWGARENDWVDRGGFGTTLADFIYEGVRRWDFGDTGHARITGTFDALAGGAYYCAGYYHLLTVADGAAGAGVGISAVMDPLTVCQPPS